MKQSTLKSGSGFSLVISLVILTLLAILMVSFLSTTALERTTARAFGSKAGAELAAQTATNQAMSMLAERIAKYPDSATVWETLSGPGESFEGTVLYYSEDPNNPTAARRLFPLVSRGIDANAQLLGDVEVADRLSALGSDAWTNENSLDLNRPRSNSDGSGWIGATPNGRRPYRARWIEVKGTTQSGQAPKTVARYAFWMEDESFKVNLNLLQAAARGQETTSPGTMPSEVPIQGLLRSLRTTMDKDTLASDSQALRDGFFGRQLFDLRAFNRANPNYRLGDESKFLATVQSGALNLSRHGSQRLNLNGLGFDKPQQATSPPDTEINKQIQQIVATLKHHAPKFGQRFYRQNGTAAAANLNNESSVSVAHQEIYVHKFAANLRDYIDLDSQPTLVLSGGKVAARSAPALAMSANDGDNEYWAQGKEGAPFLQEAVARWRSSCSNPTLRYDLKVDYYIEFWNMTGKDIYAKVQTDPARQHLNNAFVRVADPVGWFAHGGGTPPLTADNSPSGNPGFGRDVKISLVDGVYLGGGGGAAAPEGVVFKAGVCTVITTDPDQLVQLSAGSSAGNCYTTGGLNKANTYYCSQITGKRQFAGPIPNPGSFPAKVDGIWAQFRDAPDSSGKNLEDYGTEVIFGNDLGYIDSHPYTISAGGGPLITYRLASGGKTSRDDTYGGTLFGNGNSPSQLGDPRTNNEQLQFMRWVDFKPAASSTDEPDQTRYYNPLSTDQYRFSLGWPNSRYVFPDGRNVAGALVSGAHPWKDYYKVWSKTDTNTANENVPSPAANTAPAFVANENLKSIGQLGDIFDPARVSGDGIKVKGIEFARGGGRTFKIGQKDDLVDMSSPVAASQQWASWRLSDFLATSNALYQTGLININGLRRDDGAALRAACYGLKLQSVSQTSSGATPTVTASAELNSEEDGSSGVRKVIDEAILRMNGDPIEKPTYFRERGELSELELFSSENTDFWSTVKASNTFDRSREEFFRRLVELITTRGNIFSVYAVGQAITEGNDPQKTLHVTGEHWVKTTFALLPKKEDGSDFRVLQETFDPVDSEAVSKRFAKPHHYDLQLLQVSVP